MTTPERILIVDDEPNVRLVFRTALEAPHFEIAAADDGPSALRLLASQPQDLVLLDLHMPEMDGMEVLRRLRETGNNVPVVIITAHGSIPDAVGAMKLGAIDFLTKPITPERLRATVAEVLNRHASASATEPTPQPAPQLITAEAQFASHLLQAKRALNRRWFDEAEIFLKQAIALGPASAEAHNLKGVLHELRNEHDASYRSYRAALKADRHYEPARHNMQRYYERFTFGKTNLALDTGESRGATQ